MREAELPSHQFEPISPFDSDDVFSDFDKTLETPELSPEEEAYVDFVFDKKVRQSECLIADYQQQQAHYRAMGSAIDQLINLIRIANSLETKVDNAAVLKALADFKKTHILKREFTEQLDTFPLRLSNGHPKQIAKMVEILNTIKRYPTVLADRIKAVRAPSDVSTAINKHLGLIAKQTGRDTANEYYPEIIEEKRRIAEEFKFPYDLSFSGIHGTIASINTKEAYLEKLLENYHEDDFERRWLIQVVQEEIADLKTHLSKIENQPPHNQELETSPGFKVSPIRPHLNLNSIVTAETIDATIDPRDLH